jgi:hypothetical protein
MGIGVGQTSGWFLPSAAAAAAAAAATPGSAPSGVPGPNVGAEYGLPTPESVGHGHAFGQFGTRWVFSFYFIIIFRVFAVLLSVMSCRCQSCGIAKNAAMRRDVRRAAPLTSLRCFDVFAWIHISFHQLFLR